MRIWIINRHPALRAPRTSRDSRDVFFEKLTRNWKAYRKWAKDTLLDVSEMELWLQYLLP